jgi:hypothetical protein
MRLPTQLTHFVKIQTVSGEIRWREEYAANCHTDGDRSADLAAND